MINGEFVGELNIQRFFDTLARLVGEQNGVEITVTSIKKKEPDEDKPA